MLNLNVCCLIGKGYPLWLDWAFAGVSRGHPGERVTKHEGVHTAFYDL